jgi:hypothetical protein
MSCPYFRPERAAERVATLAAHVAPGASEGGGDASTRCPHALSLSPAAASPLARAPCAAGDYASELRACRAELWQLLEEVNCNPILVRHPRPLTAPSAHRVTLFLGSHARCALSRALSSLFPALTAHATAPLPPPCVPPSA